MTDADAEYSDGELALPKMRSIDIETLKVKVFKIPFLDRRSVHSKNYVLTNQMQLVFCNDAPRYEFEGRYYDLVKRSEPGTLIYIIDRQRQKRTTIEFTGLVIKDMAVMPTSGNIACVYTKRGMENSPFYLTRLHFPLFTPKQEDDKKQQTSAQCRCS